MFHQLSLHAHWVCTRHVTLIDSNDDCFLCLLGVLDSLFRLRHDTVIRRNNEHDNIGNIRTTGAHFSENRVTRCINEADWATFMLYPVGTDVLGDPPCLTLGDAALPNEVEE